MSPCSSPISSCRWTRARAMPVATESTSAAARKGRGGQPSSKWRSWRRPYREHSHASRTRPSRPSGRRCAARKPTMCGCSIRLSTRDSSSSALSTRRRSRAWAHKQGGRGPRELGCQPGSASQGVGAPIFPRPTS
eukprot:scaffold81150_cov45-Phaeocystis_antarctica.AAC.1